MSDKQPPDNEDDEDLQRWHDPWGLTERENEILCRWVYVGVAVIIATTIAICMAQ